MLFITATPVLARTYGSGAYGSCTYGLGDCLPTPATTPTGLDVTINLQNGQAIPPAGTDIIVTQVNTTGPDVQTVQIIVNGTTVGTVPGGSNNTTDFFFVPPPGVTALDIQIIITGTDSSTVTKEFHVVVLPAGPAATPGSSHRPPSTPNATFIAQLAGLPLRILEDIGGFIGKLPPPIKYGLPWFLFAILAADILYLAYNIRRQLKELKQLKGLIEREKEMVALKHTFLSLASHYMRTPMATLMGGADLLSPVNKTAASAIIGLQNQLKTLSNKIESLIKTNPESSLVTIGQELNEKPPVPTWREPMLLLPVVLIGIAAFSFDYLAQNGNSFNLPEINLIIQIVVFGSLAMLLYMATYLHQLHKAETAKAKQVLDEQAQFNEQRDQFINLAAGELSDTVADLDVNLKNLGANPASKFLGEGQRLLHNLVSKLRVAQQITGSAATTPYVTTKLSELYTAALQTLQAKTTAKHINVKLASDLPLVTQSPELLTFVLQSVLDNAVDYSPDGALVELSGDNAGGHASVTITDHGSGIAEDKKYELFQAFSKLEGAEVFNHEGMGFSLYLDKLIMSYLHGGITIDSVKPMGTEVTLTLPIAA